MENRPGKITLAALGLIVCMFVGRIQEIFPLLSRLYLGKLAVALGLLLCLSSSRLRDVLGWKQTKLMAALWFWGALTIPLSVWPGSSFHFWLIGLTSLLVFYLVIACYASDLDNSMFLVKGMVLCGLLFCFEIIFLGVRTASGRIDVTRGSLDPNDLALMLVSTFPFFIAFYQTGKKREKAFAACLLVLSFPAIFLTGSRGGVIGLFTVLLAMTFGRKTKLTTKVLIVGLAGCSLFFLPHELVVRFKAVWNGTDYNYKVGRIEIWKQAARLFITHILTGVGGAQSHTAMGMAYGHTAWKACHDIFFQIGLELGLPGLLLFLAMLYTIWKNIHLGLSAVAFDEKNPVRILLENARLSLLGYIVCGIFLADAYSPVVPFLLAFTNGLASLALRTRAEQARLSKPLDFEIIRMERLAIR